MLVPRTSISGQSFDIFVTLGEAMPAKAMPTGWSGSASLTFRATQFTRFHMQSLPFSMSMGISSSFPTSHINMFGSVLNLFTVARITRIAFCQ